MNASGGNWGQQLEGTFTNVFQRARGQFNGYGFNLPTQDLVDEFEDGDPRLDRHVFQEGDVMGDRGVFTIGRHRHAPPVLPQEELQQRC